MVEAAFIGWQHIEFFKAILYKKPNPTPFEKYLTHFGLREKEKTTPQQREAEVARKVKKAEAIRRKDQQRKKV